MEQDTHWRYRLYQLAAECKTTRMLFYLAVKEGLIEKTPAWYERLRLEGFSR
jgi:hypothetical protein